MNKIPPCVLTFSALDSSSGAGLTADALTLFKLQVHPFSIITANTIQNSANVLQVNEISADTVYYQAATILDEFADNIKAIKIGVIYTIENVEVIVKILQKYNNIPVIFDPVLISGNGNNLVKNQTEFINYLTQNLLPLCFLITPNYNELFALANLPSNQNNQNNQNNKNNIEKSINKLFSYNVKNILLTGTDFFISNNNNKNQTHIKHQLFIDNFKNNFDFLVEKINASFHGSGCTLSSSIAAEVAKQVPLKNAVSNALNFTELCLKNAFRNNKISDYNQQNFQFIPNRNI